ncbi:hypothetical protein Barb4_02377 [Bacteroidales bacterium Barb4]|nr:hypothetical protein Barb4_02377 [Bacteroidales bacterium Barb4]
MNITAVKKTHSVKNNMLLLPDLRVVWPSQTQKERYMTNLFVTERTFGFLQVSAYGRMVDF